METFNELPFYGKLIYVAVALVLFFFSIIPQLLILAFIAFLIWLF